jgi:hypothetical protein
VTGRLQVLHSTCSSSSPGRSRASSYRKTLQTEEKKRFFDEKIKQLLELHGVDYVRGYVDGLRETR